MNKNEQTYLNLFKYDINGIGKDSIISKDDLQDAITVWSKKAQYCLDIGFLNNENADFYYNFVEYYLKNHFETTNKDYVEFRKNYTLKVLTNIDFNKNLNSSTNRDPYSKYVSFASHSMKNGCMSKQQGIEELALILAKDPSFNSDGINLKFDSIKQDKLRTHFSSFSKKDNTITIDRENMVYKCAKAENINDTFEIVYEILYEICKQNKINHMNQELTLSALNYNIERNYKRAFKQSAFSYMIDVPAIEHDSKMMTINHLSKVADLLAESYYSSVLKTFSTEKYNKIYNEPHYNQKTKNQYGTISLISESKMKEELITKSLLSLRANPKSLPTNIKRTLFIDGELKTLYKLNHELEELKNTKYATTIPSYSKKIKELEALIDYLVSYCIPTKIESAAMAYNDLDDENKEELLNSLKELKSIYPSEYDTTISILKNRLNRLNSYSASSTHATTYFEEIINTERNLNLLTSIENVEIAPAMNNFVNVTYKDKESKITPEIVYVLQKLTGKGVREIMNSINNNEDLLILHNIPAPLAKYYTNSRSVKKNVIMK